MSNYSTENRTHGETMTDMKKTIQNTSVKAQTPQDADAAHTCACGETHPHTPGSPSHRDACTSPKKFGDSCCCGTDSAATNTHRCCGHEPQDK